MEKAAGHITTAFLALVPCLTRAVCVRCVCRWLPGGTLAALNGGNGHYTVSMQHFHYVLLHTGSESDFDAGWRILGPLRKTAPQVEFVASMAGLWGTPGSFNKAAADDLVHRIPGRQNFTDAPALVQEGITSSRWPSPDEP